MHDVLQDIRFAARALRRSPLFAAVALLTLGAGVGLTVAVFAVVNAVLLRPLEYADAETLVLMQGQPGARHGLSMPHYMLFREHSDLLADAAAWQGWSPVMEGPDGSPSRRSGASVSASFFAVARVEPAAGRFFTAEDGMPGHEPVVVLGHELWVSRFGGDRSVLDRVIELDGERHRVVGVAPPDFVDPVGRGLGFAPREVWRSDPPAFADAAQDVGWVGFWSVGRLRPGARAAGLTAEMRALLAAQPGAAEYEQFIREFRAITVRDAVVEAVRPTLWVLFGAVALVLLIACANLANLLLARATVRSGEFAVRTSLGAPRSRLVRQLLTESMVLALAGAALGMVVAVVAVRVLVRLAGPSLPRAAEVGIDLPVLLFALAAAFGTALVFGAVPALRATAEGSVRAAGDGARGRLLGGKGKRLRHALVVLETALAMVLLSGAGLLLATLLRLDSVDPGFDTEGVVVMQLGLDEARLPAPELQSSALRRIEAAVVAVPGVAAAGSITDLPLSGAVNSTRVRRAEESEDAAASRRNVLVRAVTPDLFDALGLDYTRGRPLDREVRSGTEPVAIVNAEFGRRFYGSDGAVGRRVVVRGVERRIIGVVTDAREFQITSAEADAVLYTPYDQERESWMRSGVTLVVRTTGRGPALAERVRAAVLAAEPRVLAGPVRPLADLVEAQVRAPRFRATLILVFSCVAVLLAAVGVGGVVAYGVSQRTPEIGLRLAIGAEARQVLAMMLRETAALVGAGVAVGVAAALAAGRLLAGFLFQIGPSDPVVLLAAATTLLAVGFVAGWLPSRRAARVDPARTLRGDG